MHAFGRFPDATLKDLARVAIVRALNDAGIGVKDIETVYASNALAGVLQGQEQIRGQSVLRDVGIERVPVVNVENACAGASTAFAQAVMAIRAGSARVVLAIGFEKMFVGDTGRSLDALESGADIEVIAGLGPAVHRDLRDACPQADRCRATRAATPRRRRGEEPQQRRAQSLRAVPHGLHARRRSRNRRRSRSR